MAKKPLARQTWRSKSSLSPAIASILANAVVHDLRENEKHLATSLAVARLPSLQKG